MSIQPSDLVVVRELGQGAHTRVCLVRHLPSQALYCRKSVLATAPNWQSQLRQLRNEYDVGHTNEHPVLRRTISFDIVRKLLRAVEARVLLDYVEGRPLTEYAVGAPLKALLKLFWHVADGLADLHRRGFVHADLKPHNILVTGEQRPVLIDFGQSCPAGHTKERVQGTADFIAPEQVSCEPLDPRTDVFGFGATMHMVLTGKPVQTELNASSVRKGGRITLERRNIEREADVPPLDPPLRKLIEDCLHVERAQRPASMGLIKDRLEICLTRLKRTG